MCVGLARLHAGSPSSQHSFFIRELIIGSRLSDFAIRLAFL